jgi:uncharacterized protein
MLRFEWSRAKARKNYLKHGVNFELAKDVFRDPFAIEYLDDRRDYGEQRYVIIGAVEGVVLYVAYTERGEVIRIISARRATKYEEEAYYG